MRPVKLFVADFDRTITDGNLELDLDCLNAIERIRKMGVHTAVVTGRKRVFLQDFFDRHRSVFDSAICENGCRGYIDGEWENLAENRSKSQILDRFSNSGIRYDFGDCIISTEAMTEDEVCSMLSGISGWKAIINIDSVMILPLGVDKGTGILWLQSEKGFTKEETAGIGDGENDLVIRDVCGIFGTPSSAVGPLRERADFVSEKEYSRGTIDFIEHLEIEYRLLD